MKTAVEYLINIIDQTDWINYTREERLEVFNQSKEIEKRHIIDAYIDGKYESDLVVMSDKYYAEQYYNETFNK